MTRLTTPYLEVHATCTPTCTIPICLGSIELTGYTWLHHKPNPCGAIKRQLDVIQHSQPRRHMERCGAFQSTSHTLAQTAVQAIQQVANLTNIRNTADPMFTNMQCLLVVSLVVMCYYRFIIWQALQ